MGMVRSVDAGRFRLVPGRLGGVARGVVAGLVAGLPVGVLLSDQGMLAEPGAGAVPAWALFIGFVVAVGAALGLALGPHHRGLAGAASGGMLIGLLGWLVWSLTVEPVVGGQVPTWSIADAGLAYRYLVGDLLHGGLTGVLLQVLISRLPGLRRSDEETASPIGRPRVVIVGGGFAGVGAARRFERLAIGAGPPDVTLISDSNFLLFTPMLAEAASGALEPAHISAPLRAAAGRTRFRQGRVTDVDTAKGTITLAVDGTVQNVGYDQLVLAVGSVPSFLGIPGVEEHAFTLKNLRDATRLTRFPHFSRPICAPPVGVSR
jgi:NADH:ubiquinone reductase (H+-translocating)